MQVGFVMDAVCERFASICTAGRLPATYTYPSFSSYYVTGH